MFQQNNPNVNVSYDTYKHIFNTKFNFSFGYSRTDTCSTCNKFHAILRTLSTDSNADEIKQLTLANEKYTKDRLKLYIIEKRMLA